MSDKVDIKDSVEALNIINEINQTAEKKIKVLGILLRKKIQA